MTWDDYMHNPMKGALAFLKWLIVGTGPFSSLAAQAAVFVRSDDKRSVLSKFYLKCDLSNAISFTSLPFGPDLPVNDHSSGPGASDIEIVFIPFLAADDGTRNPPSGTLAMTSVRQLPHPFSERTDSFSTQGPILLKPESAGSIELRSANVYDSPLIHAK